jgi:hypothetical protein
MIQWRKRDSADDVRDKYYAPRRDLAHIGMGLSRAAMAALDEEFWEPWFRQFLTDHGVDTPTLVEGAKRYALALMKIIDTANPVVALEESKFSELPPAVQLAFYTKLGQVFLAAIWTGVKDTRKPGSAPPAEVSDLMDDIEKAFGEITGRTVPAE